MLLSNIQGGGPTQFGADAALGRGGDEGRGATPLLIQYWTILKKWKWIIAGILAACVALGLVATLLMTRQYAAISRLEIDREKRQVTGESLESSDASRDLEFYQTQYALLESPALVERVSRRLKLATKDRFFEVHGAKPDDAGLLGGTAAILSAEDRAERERQVQDILLKNISIRPLRGSSLIDVAYTSASPDISTQIANTWSQEFIQTSLDRRFSAASAARSPRESSERLAVAA